MFDFRNYITSSDPTNLSTELWETYQRAKNNPFQRQSKYVEKDQEFQGSFQPNINLERIDDFIRCYNTMQSVRNSGVSTIGTLCNEIAAHSYQLLGLQVIREYKLLKNSQRRSIDIYLPAISTYVSVTTTPRERKRSDWQNEVEQLLQLSKIGDIKDWRFVGLMFEGSKNEPKRIQDELRRASPNASVVMVKDVKSHANFLLDLCQRNQSLLETTQTLLQRSQSCTPTATQRSLI